MSASAAGELGAAQGGTGAPLAASLHAVRTAVRCLEHLRSLHRDAKMAPASSARSAQPDAPHDLTQWDTVYCLGLDYLLVAQAAAAAGLPLSAIVYCEHYCEAELGTTHRALQRLADRVAVDTQWPGQAGDGTGTRASSAAPPAAAGEAGGDVPDGAVVHRSAEEALAQVEALLSDVYGRIDEPDCIYAVAGRPGLDSQVAVFEHEGDWVGALACHDLALRFGGGGDAAAAAAATGLAAQQRLLREADARGAGAATSAGDLQGVAAALSNMGCGFTAHRFLQGVLQRWPGAGAGGLAAAGSSTLQDLQYELSWRLGTWDSDGETAASDGTRGGASTQGAGLSCMGGGQRLSAAQQALDGGAAAVMISTGAGAAGVGGFPTAAAERTRRASAAGGWPPAGHCFNAAVLHCLMSLKVRVGLALYRMAWCSTAALPG